jgi:hypothetical protein
VVLAGSLAGGGAARAACPGGHPRGVAGDPVVVGYVVAPPFVVATPAGHDVQGFAIELLRELATHEQWQLTWVELDEATLKLRLAACEIDLGVVGTAASVGLVASGSAAEPVLELSRPYFSSVTTAIVNADDDDHAEPAAGHSPIGRLAHAVLRGLGFGVVALGVLAIASWALNAAGGFSWTRSRSWRRIDAAVSGPLAGLGWLARSVTGRGLIALWLLTGVLIGATGAFGAGPPPVLRDDPLKALVERAAREEVAYGERASDGVAVNCAAAVARTCFRGLADGTMAAIAGPRELLCMHAVDLSIDGTVLRGDLDIPEQFSYLLPAASPLRSRLDLALLRQHERLELATPVRCPGDEP